MINEQNQKNCPNCGGSNLSYHIDEEKIPVSCLGVLGYIILGIIPVVGWIILIVLLSTRNSKTKKKTIAVCANCGENFRIKTLAESKKMKKEIISSLIILVLAGAFILYILSTV